MNEKIRTTVKELPDARGKRAVTGGGCVLQGVLVLRQYISMEMVI